MATKFVLALVLMSLFVFGQSTKPNISYLSKEFKTALRQHSPVLDEGIVNLWGANHNFLKKLNYGRNVEERKKGDDEEVESKMFTQKLDHFNPDDTRVFEMVDISKDF